MMARDDPTITAERLHWMFEYDSATGILIWKNPPLHHGNLRGRAAGTRKSDGYVSIAIDGTARKAHRLIWLFVYGEWPTTDLDHRNGDGFDNRLDNLRLATSSQNSANSRRRRTNTSGFKGVFWCSQAGKWAADCRRGKRRWRATFDTPEAAHAAYAKVAKELHGEFARTA